jgi:hypothetical protein
MFHLGKVSRGTDARAPDQNVIHAGARCLRQDRTRQGTKPSFGTVSRNRIADFFGTRIAHTHIIPVVTLARLQDKTGCGLAGGAGCGEKLSAFRHDMQTQCRRRFGEMQILYVGLPQGHDPRRAYALSDLRP